MGEHLRKFSGAWVRTPKVVRGQIEEIPDVAFLPVRNQDVVFLTYTGRKILGYYNGAGGFRPNDHTGYFNVDVVTHWTPLPETPVDGP